MKRSLLLSGLLLIQFFSRGQLNPLTIGTIPAGDSVVIKYIVSINNPLVPVNATSISNQGTVAGTNFVSVSTDDPDTGPGGDATLTLLNVFPLPVTLTSFRAYEAGTAVITEWKTVAESNIERYEVERSADGFQFLKIGEVDSRNSPSPAVYTFTDLQPLQGNNFYRLRIPERDGAVKYSAVVSVRTGAGIASGIRIYPNPVTHSTLHLQLLHQPAGLYTVQLYSNSGQLVLTQVIRHAGGSSGELLQLPARLAAGMYQLVIISAGERKHYPLAVY